MDSEKEPLPKGMSYPLKPSFLSQALADAGVNLDAYLKRGRQHTPPHFRAYFLRPRPGVPYERLYMVAGAVLSVEAPAVRQRMESEIIPEMIRWIQSIVSLPLNSPVRREDQEFVRRLTE